MLCFRNQIDHPLQHISHYTLIAQMLFTSPPVNLLPVAANTSSASSGESSVKSVAICCRREKDSRRDPEEKADWEER